MPTLGIALAKATVPRFVCVGAVRHCVHLPCAGQRDGGACSHCCWPQVLCGWEWIW